MIGQKNIKDWVDKVSNNFPHFIVLIGESGSGKRTVCKYISNYLSLVYSECEIRTEAVREVIDTAYKSTTKVMYNFCNADNMKVQAKNALLKITEEPPENAYFCLTLNDDTSLLDTIRSRACVMYLDGYTCEELKEYCDSINFDNKELACKICSCPGDIDLLIQQGNELYDYCVLVADNIAEVEPANAFKSSSKLALKNDEGYNLKLFWKIFIGICMERKGEWFRAALITCQYLNKVDNAGVNKQQLYDMWVLDIRSVLI